MAAHDGTYVRARIVCMFRAANIIQCALIRDRQSTGSEMRRYIRFIITSEMMGILGRA